MGPGVNIGAGTITCNYDGSTSTAPRSGRRVCRLQQHPGGAIAIAAGGVVAAGSTITRAVAADELAVSRSRQRNIGLAATGQSKAED